MSMALNSAIVDRSCSTCADAHSSELIIGNEFEVPATQALQEVRSVCGSNAVESAASVAGLSFLSSDGTTCSESKARAVTGAISWVWPDDRSKSCSSWWLGAAVVVSNLSKIKSPQISVMKFKLPNLTWWPGA